MKAFVYVTPSHARMMDKFLRPSLPKDLLLHVHMAEQVCKSGDYMSEGFVKCLLDRSRWMYDVVAENQGLRILFLDADIQFFTEHICQVLNPRLDHVNMVSINDSKYGGSKVHGSGFIAVNCCEDILKLLSMTNSIMTTTPNLNNQIAINYAIKKMKMKASTLDLNMFWSPRLLWKPDRDLNIPSTCIVHHANWCVTKKDKMDQLTKGRSLMNRFKN